MNTNEKKFTKPVVVMCEPAAVDRYDAFAKKVGMGRSEWIRDVLGKTTGDVRAIESAIGPPVVTASGADRRAVKISEPIHAIPNKRADDDWKSFAPLASDVEKKRARTKGVR